jgi:Kelch motif
MMFSSCTKEKTPQPPQFSINSAVSQGGDEVVITYTIIGLGDQGQKEHGVVYSEKAAPTILDIKASDVDFLPSNGNFYTVKNLKATTKYYFRLYLIDNNNIVTYSEEASSTTLTPTVASVFPNRGAVGATVVIKGENINTAVIKIDGIAADHSLIADTPQEIVNVTIPSGITHPLSQLTIEVGGQVFTYDFYYLNGVWTQLSNGPANSLGYMPGFSIGGIGYAGLVLSPYLSQYDAVSDHWSAVATSPLTSGKSYQEFTINDKAYILSEATGDLICYDPAAGSWTPKKKFPGLTGRSRGITLAINSIGYYGLGQNFTTNGYLKDFWKYDPTTNEWTQLQDFSGAARQLAMGATIGGKGYLTCGFSDVFFNDLWEYTPGTDSWIKKKDLPGNARYGSASLVLNNKFYVLGGTTEATTPSSEVFYYDPSADQWGGVVDIPFGLLVPVGFTINGKAYVGPAQNILSMWRLDL